MSFQRATDKILQSNEGGGILSVIHLGLLLEDQQKQSSSYLVFASWLYHLGRNIFCQSYSDARRVILYHPCCWVIFGTRKRPLRPRMNSRESSITEHSVLHVSTVPLHFPERMNCLIMLSYLLTILRAT